MHFEIVERGHGTPLVVVPGVQGRWEYSRGLVEALAREYRVITFSLCDERSGHPDASSPMDVFANQVAFALDRTRTERAPIVGVSFGGLVALRFAARRAVRTGGTLHLLALVPRQQFVAFGGIQATIEEEARLRAEER